MPLKKAYEWYQKWYKRPKVIADVFICATFEYGPYDYWANSAKKGTWDPVSKSPVNPPAPKPKCSHCPVWLDLCDDVSPLVLDLDGDGVEASAVTFFDHEGDGFYELSNWASEDDGVLVWDSNSDGVINDGSELFGNNTVLADGSLAANGFAALAELDDNGDGAVDSSDSAWSELRVMRWSDDNGNGFRDEGEEYSVTLEEAGVVRLNTGYVDSDYVDDSGNGHRQVGNYGKSDGTLATMTDVWFVTNAAVSAYDTSAIPEHSEEILALPDKSGSGRVYDLRDAMALDDAVDESGASRLVAPFYSNAREETRSLRELVAA